MKTNGKLADGRRIEVVSLQSGQAMTYTTEEVEVFEVTEGRLKCGVKVFEAGTKTREIAKGKKVTLRAWRGPVTYRRIFGPEPPAPVEEPEKSTVPASELPPAPESAEQQVLLATLQAAVGKRGTLVLKTGTRLFFVIRRVLFEGGRWVVVVHNGEKDSTIALVGVDTFEKQ